MQKTSYFYNMQKGAVLISLVLATVLLVSFVRTGDEETGPDLRKIYSQSPGKWPAPLVDTRVKWAELGILPESPLEKHKDSLKHLIELGKALFFDTRLSESGQISCATCHKPELNWTDGKERSVGHEGALAKRNAPTIQNTWFYKRLFWDGRAKDLQDQAFAPINSETEMHSEMPDVLRKLRNVKGYAPLFKAAFGSEQITPDNFTQAIAIFEKTIVSRKSRFDEFLGGDKNALTDKELRGLHVFRTTARCMNCHNGPLFTDNQFHNTGITFSDGKDKGLYAVTHNDLDIGKFKTPSLRDVMNTGPWMHDGGIEHMMTIIELYDKSSPTPAGADNHLGLSGKQKADLLAFLGAISTRPREFKKPVIPD
ncbi:MAG TPA: cytochrome-c peroxidase [Chitinophagaceae bacterium]|nr:cytochrome-c peroxidase [Chitinophagaceae bacterium]